MSRIITSLKSGNWKALLACFLYFDTGFTVWVMFGSLAPFIAKQISLSATQAAFLVAVPVLVASIVRVTFGNLFQAVNGRTLALLGIALSALPAVLLMLPRVPGFPTLLVLAGFLGVGGASFAVALPMAGSSYPARVQGLVLGIAAAGNIGAVVDGFVFPGLAQRIGWQHATAAVLPLLALTALVVVLWADDKSPKSGRAAAGLAGFGASLIGIIALVLLVNAGVFGHGNLGLLLLPVLGAVLALAVLPRRYLTVLTERDSWVVMLIYSITFGGFVGMTSYVTLLLTSLYNLSKLVAGLVLAGLSFTGALVRPVGGWIADRLSGVRVLMVLLTGISLCNFVFAAVSPGLHTGVLLLIALYLGFGLGNGATFQLVPQRWKGKTGVMTGIIGAAGGIGGFYLPVVMGIARQSTGSYQMGFVTFGVLAALALLAVGVLRQRWLTWALPADAAASAP